MGKLHKIEQIVFICKELNIGQVIWFPEVSKYILSVLEIDK